MIFFILFAYYSLLNYIQKSLNITLKSYTPPLNMHNKVHVIELDCYLVTTPVPESVCVSNLSLVVVTTLSI